jgi:hypothetical protein
MHKKQGLRRAEAARFGDRRAVLWGDRLGARSRDHLQQQPISGRLKPVQE